MTAAIPSTMMEQPLVLPSVLRHAELYHADRQIHSRSADGVVSVTTYAESATRARRLAAGLASLGIGPGDRVGTLALNSSRHVEVYFAAAGMGAVYHTLNPRLTADQAAYIVGHAEDKVLCFDPHLAPLVAKFRSVMPGVRHWIALGPEAVDAGGATIASEDLIASGPETFDWPDVDERAAAALCYTSGTTGNPKGVLYSHRALVVQALAACLPDAENISATDNILVVVPMFHVNGWGLPYSGAITGAGLVLPGPRVDGASLVDLMARYDVTLGAAVPTIWQDVILELERSGQKLPSLARVINGGSAPSRSLVRSFADRGIRMLHGWGMTETTAGAAFSAPLTGHRGASAEQQVDLAISQGRPMFPLQIRIVDPDGSPLPHDGVTTGEVQIRGLWITGRYYRGDPTTTADGWLPTGDIGSIDEHGYLRLSDRAKDLIKSGGEWISSVALEGAILEHPAISQAAVVGAPDPRWGERPVLFAVLKPGADEPSIDEIRDLVSPPNPRWWAPDKVEWPAELPLGATGKVLKRELRDALRDAGSPRQGNGG
jgi:acyl-CoA synthetase (AMP-forming)/AMP-acid ligase II